MTGTLNPTSFWNWMALSVLLVGYPIFLGLLIGRIPRFTEFFRGDHRSWRAFWGITLAVEWAVTLAIVVSLLLGGNVLADIGMALPSRSASIAGAVSILVLMILTVRLHSGSRVPVSPDPQSALLPHTRRERVMWLLAISPTAAFCEEVAYRGFLLTLLRPAIGIWVALGIQALLFSFHHGGLAQGLRAFSLRTAIALGLGLMVIWRGNLLAAMTVHFAIDSLFALMPVRAGTVAMEAAQ